MRIQDLERYPLLFGPSPAIWGEREDCNSGLGEVGRPAGCGIGIKDSGEPALGEVRAAGSTPYAIPAGQPALNADSGIFV